MIKIIAALLAISLSSFSMASPESDAIAFVEKTGVGGNLTNMALMAASNMQTYRIMVKDIGENKAHALVKRHVEKIATSNQKQWNKNLAISYLEYFSVEELNSIILEKTNSPYIDKFRNKQREVGASMQNRSSQLLQNIVSEAMTNAFKESTASNKQ